MTRQKKLYKTNPKCKEHRIPMRRRGTIKDGESRYFCVVCEQEKAKQNAKGETKQTDNARR